MDRRRKHIRRSGSDWTLRIIVDILMILLCIVILYPLIYVLSCSFSSGSAVAAGRVTLLPVDFSLTGYQLVFSYKAIWTGYANSVYITVVATALNLALTICCAYPLSRRKFQGKQIYMLLFLIPMFFSGGMIPTYILTYKLGLINSRWSVILSGAVSIYNMIIMRTFFQNSIPEELYDAAKVDGITDIGYLRRIVLPLSKSVIAVIVLYYAVGHWNSYFNAMLYLRDKQLWPLQLVIRGILNAVKMDLDVADAETLMAMTNATELLKYSVIVVSSLPVLIAYPFVQKYFQKGVMIGSVKG